MVAEAFCSRLIFNYIPPCSLRFYSPVVQKAASLQNFQTLALVTTSGFIVLLLYSVLLDAFLSVYHSYLDLRFCWLVSRFLYRPASQHSHPVLAQFPFLCSTASPLSFSAPHLHSFSPISGSLEAQREFRTPLECLESNQKATPLSLVDLGHQDLIY